MAKYELMYIVGSQTSDDEISKVVDEVKKYISDNAGIIEKSEELGKKKLAYPIKKSRNGYYVVVNFSAPSEKVNDIEHRIRTSQNVIRHLIINMDEALIQLEKDRVAQSSLKIRRPMFETKEEPKEPARRGSGEGGKKIEIDLDAEIEKALETPDLK